MKPGRNDPCLCGSGKKYKKCCQAKLESSRAALKLPAIETTPSSLELNQLVDLFNSGNHVELENRTRLLIEHYPNFGFIWKVLGATLQVQGKNALFSLTKATELLPDDAEAHSNLGNALKELGQLEGAAACYRQALKLRPDYVEAQNNLGNTLKDSGQLNDALSCYLDALKINPDYAEAHCNLGLIQQELGQYDNAAKSYCRALQIKPDFAEVYNNLGNLRRDLGQFEEAITYYCSAIEIKPSLVDAYISLGIILKTLGRIKDAAACYYQALEIAPANAELHFYLGVALQQLGELNDAVASYQRAREINPNYAEVYCNMGVAFKDLGQFDKAIENYHRALDIKPDYADAHFNLANALKGIGQLDDSVANYRCALKIKPDYAEAFCNMGDALKELTQLDEAVDSYRRALEINPEYSEARCNLGIALLHLGNLAEGWQNYESRWEGGTPKISRPITSLPQWLGQDPNLSDRLLVFDEQGLGDKLQFSRYLPLVAEYFPAGVSFVVGSLLKSLFIRSFPHVEILDEIPGNQAAWQWQCPLLSLPLAFHTSLENLPKQIPYLIPDPIKVAYWNNKIAGLELPISTRKIGIVWKSGSRMKIAQLKSLSLEQLAPLFKQQNCSFFSLQIESDPDKNQWVTSGKLIDWTVEFLDFDDTAALIMNMDLIISVDTAVLHLAAGLGRPTWLFNRYASDWRWMKNCEDSPWYPTMRLFTQKIAGKWNDVVTCMSDQLLKLDVTNN